MRRTILILILIGIVTGVQSLTSIRPLVWCLGESGHTVHAENLGKHCTHAHNAHETGGKHCTFHEEKPCGNDLSFEFPAIRVSGKTVPACIPVATGKRIQWCDTLTLGPRRFSSSPPVPPPVRLLTGTIILTC